MLSAQKIAEDFTLDVIQDVLRILERGEDNAKQSQENNLH